MKLRFLRVCTNSVVAHECIFFFKRLMRKIVLDSKNRYLSFGFSTV